MLFINGTETIDEYSSIFKIKIKDRRYIVMGKFLTISSLIKNYDRVLLFKIHKDIKEVNEANNKWGCVKLDNIIGKSESILNIKSKTVIEDLKDLRDKLELNKSSKVLMFSTEGDTDPDMYRKIVWKGMSVDSHDLMLSRVLAGDTLTKEDIYHYGHGGLCMNCEECRFPNCSFGKEV